MLNYIESLLNSEDDVVRQSGIELVLSILSRVKIVDLTDGEVDVIAALYREV